MAMNAQLAPVDQELALKIALSPIIHTIRIIITRIAMSRMATARFIVTSRITIIRVVGEGVVVAAPRG